MLCPALPSPPPSGGRAQTVPEVPEGDSLERRASLLSTRDASIPSPALRSSVLSFVFWYLFFCSLLVEETRCLVLDPPRSWVGAASRRFCSLGSAGAGGPAGRGPGRGPGRVPGGAARLSARALERLAPWAGLAAAAALVLSRRGGLASSVSSRWSRGRSCRVGEPVAPGPGLRVLACGLQRCSAGWRGSAQAGGRKRGCGFLALTVSLDGYPAPSWPSGRFFELVPESFFFF